MHQARLPLAPPGGAALPSPATRPPTQPPPSTQRRRRFVPRTGCNTKTAGAAKRRAAQARTPARALANAAADHIPAAALIITAAANTERAHGAGLPPSSRLHCARGVPTNHTPGCNQSHALPRTRGFCAASERGVWAFNSAWGMCVFYIASPLLSSLCTPPHTHTRPPASFALLALLPSASA